MSEPQRIAELRADLERAESDQRAADQRRIARYCAEVLGPRAPGATLEAEYERLLRSASELFVKCESLRAERLALLAEHGAELDGLHAELRTARDELAAVTAERDRLAAERDRLAADLTAERDKPNDLRIIGALVRLLTTIGPQGQAPLYGSQEAVITGVIDFYGDRHGLSARTMQRRFAQANKLTPTP